MPNITVLFTTDGKHAAKTYTRRPDGKINETPYRCGYMFGHQAIPVDGIDDVYALLQALEERETSFLIHGEVIPEFATGAEITRTLLDIPKKNQQAMLRRIADGEHLMACDFDKIDLPAGMSPQDGVERLVQTLPAEFQQVTYVYQLSSSSGISGTGVKPGKVGNDEVEEEFDYPGWSKISAHVFFWMKEKSPHLCQWQKNLNAKEGHRVLDPAIMETVQPNYCAKPKFINMPDPVAGHRSGLVRKATDEVDLVWIDAPPRFVKIDQRDRVGFPDGPDGAPDDDSAGKQTVYKVGERVRTEDGRLWTATPSLRDRLAMIGAEDSYRDPLKSLIAYYYWLKGRTAERHEITSLIENAPIDWGGRNYLGQPLDSMIDWFELKNDGHEPMQSALDDVLAARLIEWKKNQKPLPDAEAEAPDSWVFDLEQSGLYYYFIGDECGKGKTEWLIDRIERIKRRYVVVLPRIDNIREFLKRLVRKHPNIEQHYLLHTIYTDKDGDIRDSEDAADDQFASSTTTVTHQIQQFRLHLGSRRNCVLFITHAGMLLSDWSTWVDFELFVDEIPEVSITQNRNFSNTTGFVRDHLQIADSETNYHRLGLTDAGWRKLGINGSFDDNEQPTKGLMEAVKQPNVDVYAHKEGWDNMEAGELLILRLVRGGFVRYFRNVTIMGDEFKRSLLAMGFTNKYGVEWTEHPDWDSTARVRKVPMKDRARIFYFAAADELRGSLTQFENGNIIPKLIAWFKANVTKQTLFTTNTRYKHLFETPQPAHDDTVYVEGVYRKDIGKKIDLLWVPPRQAGTDVYKTMTSVAFFAAMRPSRDEASFLHKALAISEDDTIRWREYNALYQFVMRIVFRMFDSAETGDIYVYDETQANYLRDRFGGCLEFTHIKGAIPATKVNKGGRPKGSIKPPKPPKPGTMTAAERKRKQREKAKQAGEPA